MSATGPVDKGRMIWKAFVRIYEGVGVRFPHATRRDTQHPPHNHLSWGCAEAGEPQKRQGVVGAAGDGSGGERFLGENPHSSQIEPVIPI